MPPPRFFRYARKPSTNSGRGSLYFCSLFELGRSALEVSAFGVVAVRSAFSPFSSSALYVVCPLGCLYLAVQRHETAALPPPPTRAEIWARDPGPQAARYRIDPAFIYALVALRVGFDPRKCRQRRGLWPAPASNPAPGPTWPAGPSSPRCGTGGPTSRRASTSWRSVAVIRCTRQPDVEFSYPLLLMAAFGYYGLDYVGERRLDVRPDSANAPTTPSIANFGTVISPPVAPPG